MNGKPFKMVPILIGEIDNEVKSKIIEALLPYFNNPNSLFCISSNFCHWGEDWEFTEYDQSYSTINDYIRALDDEGLKVLSTQDPNVFIILLFIAI